MHQLKSLTLYLYNHDLIRYLFVGGSTFIIDLGLLFLLHGKMGVNLQVATTLAYWTSIAFNFFVNRFWTFTKNEKKKLHENAVFYGVLLFVNYLYTVLAVTILTQFVHFSAAKIIAVVISTSWTYYLYKNYVFGKGKGYHRARKFIKLKFGSEYRLKIILVLLAVILYTGLFFSAFQLRSLNTANNIDGSWTYAIASLRHTTEQSLGNDVFFTYGPLSVKIITTVYHSDALSDYLISLGILSLIFLLCLFVLLYAISKIDTTNAVVILGLLILLQFGEPTVDGLFFATALASLLALAYQKFTVHPARQGLILLAPLVLSTYKNNLLIASLIVCVVVVLSQTKLKRALISASVILSLYLAVLALEGVSLLNIPKFLAYSIRDALAYNEFMSLATNGSFAVGFFVSWLFFSAYLLIGTAERNRTLLKNKLAYLQGFLPTIGEIGIIWVAFKGASTRSDGHIVMFLPFIFYMAGRIIVIAANKRRYFSAMYTLPICLVLVGAYMLIFVPKILDAPRESYLQRTVKNFTLLEAYHQYNYSYFEYQKLTSQYRFKGLQNDVLEFRKMYESYAANTGRTKIIGYTNTIFYLPAITDNYRYSLFLQTYQAFPPSLFDPMYKKHLEDNPETLVFWTNLNPSVDGRMPTGDLPLTFDYIRDNYRVVAEYNGLYLFANNSGIKNTKSPNSCNEEIKHTFTNTPTRISSSTKNIKIEVKDGSYLPIDILYKKPVYHIFFFDGAGREKIYRTTPSLLESGIDVNPLQPSFVLDPKENFVTEKIMISATDLRESPVEITEKACSR